MMTEGYLQKPILMELYGEQNVWRTCLIREKKGERETYEEKWYYKIKKKENEKEREREGVRERGKEKMKNMEGIEQPSESKTCSKVGCLARYMQ